ncbi:unnamed protein product [Tilletia controversa]|nr:unnamed protein product [Tilletia controversa]
MIGIESFVAINKGADLINTARGTVVDLHALADVLESGHLGVLARLRKRAQFRQAPSTNGVSRQQDDPFGDLYTPYDMKTSEQDPRQHRDRAPPFSGLVDKTRSYDPW